MEVTDASVENILFNFYKLTKESRSRSYDRNMRGYQLREKNLAVLRKFLWDIKILFDESTRTRYLSDTERYFDVLNKPQFDEEEVNLCITDIMYYIHKVEGGILYNRFLSTLSEYKM